MAEGSIMTLGDVIKKSFFDMLIQDMEHFINCDYIKNPNIDVDTINDTIENIKYCKEHRDYNFFDKIGFVSKSLLANQVRDLIKQRHNIQYIFEQIGIDNDIKPSTKIKQDIRTIEKFEQLLCRIFNEDVDDEVRGYKTTKNFTMRLKNNLNTILKYKTLSETSIIKSDVYYKQQTSYNDVIKYFDELNKYYNLKASKKFRTFLSYILGE